MFNKIIDTINNSFSRLNKKPKIVLTGSNGFLGSRIFSFFSKKYYMIPLRRDKINIYDLSSLQNFFNKIKPDYIIHTAAISNPDYCEKNKNESLKANVEYTKNLIEICKNLQTKFIFISSSMVFKPLNNPNEFFTEKSVPNATNYYGITKIKAEELVKQLDDYLIVRISWQYSHLKDKYINSNSMLHYIYNELSRDKKISVNKNSYANPTYVYDTIFKLFEIFEKMKGIVHISADTYNSMDYYFLAIAAKLNLNKKNIIIEEGPIENQIIKSERVKIASIEKLGSVLKYCV
jgi:dTDP-4-dehydrorhamnose reductase